MTTAQLVPALVIPLIAWRVYLRVRRSIGRQILKPARLGTSLGIFSLVTAMITIGALHDQHALLGLAGGLLIGVPLALVALRLTRFEFSPEGNFYTPNTIIGLGVTLLLLSRIAYRITVTLSAPPLARPSLFQSPLTLFFFGITAGYYLAFYAGLLSRARRGA